MTSATTETYTVTIDYPQPFGQMIAVGAYDDVNSHITEASFPIERGDVAVRELILVHLGGVASTGDVLHALDDLGVRSARIEELLAFGATYPAAQRQFPIVALGRDRDVLPTPPVPLGLVPRAPPRPALRREDLEWEHPLR